jgi:Flp pilus assembly protein TadG
MDNHMGNHAYQLIRRFLSASPDGNVAIIFALCLVPTIFLAGMAIDFASATQKRVVLNAAADAAALAAVTPSMMQQSASTAKTTAQNTFNAMASGIAGVQSATPTVTVATSGQSRTVTVSYTASSTNSFPSVLRQATWPLSGSSQAAGSSPVYVNFYLLLDDSPSMGIGATPSDIAAMGAVNNGCAFACHGPDALDQSVYPGYTLPVVPGTQLRIDALVSATSQLISTAIANESVSNQFKIGLYTFSNTVTTVAALTTNLTQVKTLNSAITLPTQDTGTQIGDAVNWLGQNVVTTASGTGTQSSPIEYVFLVTDGAEDHAFNYTSGSYDTLTPPTGNWNGTAYGSVMQSSACTSLKNQGVTVAVLYPNYDAINDIRYTDMVAPFDANIGTALQSCASPNFYFQADHASDITTAMQEMFAAALAQSARLTQ